MQMQMVHMVMVQVMMVHMEMVQIFTWKWQSLRPSQPASPLVLRSPHQYPPSAEGSYNHHGDIW